MSGESVSSETFYSHVHACREGGRAPASCDWGSKSCTDMDTCTANVLTTIT